MGESIEKDFFQKNGRKYAWKLLCEIYDSDDSKPITAKCSKRLFNSCGLNIEIDSEVKYLKSLAEIKTKKEIWENPEEKMSGLRNDLKLFFKELINPGNASKFNTMFFILYCFKANGVSVYVQLANLFFVKNIDFENIKKSGWENQRQDTYGDFIFSILTL